MNVILFGATGMVGQGVLRECLLDAGVRSVLPGIIPLHRITSRTPLYRVAHGLTRPFWPVLYRAFPQFVTTTERLGRGVLRIARRGTPKPILEARDINALTADGAS